MNECLNSQTIHIALLRHGNLIKRRKLCLLYAIFNFFKTVLAKSIHIHVDAQYEVEQYVLNK